MRYTFFKSLLEKDEGRICNISYNKISMTIHTNAKTRNFSNTDIDTFLPARTIKRTLVQIHIVYTI